MAKFVILKAFSLAKKIHILFLMLTLGFFLMSNMGYACGETSETTSCEKKAISKKETTNSCQKDCCKKTDNSKKDQHGCSGKCDHSGCTASGLQFSLIAINEFEFNSNLFNFSFKKTIPYYKNSSLSDGFTSIWQPPKIG
ncbi:hypothetical protein Q1W71_12760 [Flavobacterium pectinovorum]|uniref:hypothetical protein n=1 Tax=Flavobacterium pectinovorum TaxID=29533 RepID=UPI00265E1478|nr:hypothetical protein [Flavobacterium pectinovorum]WKL45829.1 hypothetical protein Q1W71_12760 [Flavobacterium pectinovorum]